MTLNVCTDLISANICVFGRAVRPICLKMCVRPYSGVRRLDKYE